jgi:putative endopeptidase
LNRAPLLAMLVAAGCAGAAKPPPSATPRAAPPAEARAAPPPAVPGIDPSIIDPSVRPCADFYQYACGGWLRSTEMPGDRARFTRSFDVMREQNKARLRGIVDAAAAGKVDPQDRYGQAVADLYGACMDEGAAEQHGLQRLKAEWKKLDEVKDPRSLAAAVGRLHAEGIFPFFEIGSEQDAKRSTEVIGQVAQGGLTLPDRDYYVSQDPKAAAIRKDLLAHVEKELALAEVPARQAAADSKAIVALETQLAESHWTRVELRDPNRIYNRIELAGLQKAAPHFDWGAYLAALGWPTLTTFTATTPRSVQRLEALVRRTPPATWRAYLRWHVLETAAHARALPKALTEEAFWFGAKHFTGEKEMPARWKHCVELTDGLMGEALGQAFVRRFFGGDAKAKALSLVKGIQAAMGDDLDQLSWMDDPTRAKAREKLVAVVNKIGYPDVWRSYDGLAIARSDFLASVIAAQAFEVHRQLAKIGKPLDRTEWGMTTPTVNAYYNPPMNEIVFPAGILQPPFYTQGANEAVNYGAIGLVVGHELTHGFDDQGRQYDAQGNLRDWWSPPVGQEFVRRASCLEKQFSGYTAIDDVKVNGALTMGENIADLGGLKLAYTAYEASRAGKPPEAPVGGFTPEQQFFLAHAQAWCTLIRPENARLRALTDPHSPPRWRVNGPLSNLPQFAKAFACKPGDEMVRGDACTIW